MQRRVLGLVLAIYSLAFLAMAVVHAGVPIPLGFATLRDVPIPGAVPFEGLCGLLLAVAAVCGLAGAPRAWSAAQLALGISLFFVLIGLYFVGSGQGGSILNRDFHECIGVLLVVTMAALFLPRIRSAVGGA
jgi:hypothetical protein